MYIRKAAQSGVVYNIKRRYAPQDGVARGPRDETKIFVLDVVREDAEDPEVDVRKVRCSMEAQAWLAASPLQPTEHDVETFYADRIADDMAHVLSQPTGDKYIELFYTMDYYALWEQHLRSRRAGTA